MKEHLFLFKRYATRYFVEHGIDKKYKFEYFKSEKLEDILEFSHRFKAFFMPSSVI